jgi:hypothetical protein
MSYSCNNDGFDDRIALGRRTGHADRRAGETGRIA